MEVKVNLSPEQINNQIAEAIAKSAIGVELEKAIKKNVESVCRSYQNPFDPIIKGAINEAIAKILKEDFQETIEKEIKERLSDKGLVTELFNKLLGHALDRL